MGFCILYVYEILKLAQLPSKQFDSMAIGFRFGFVADNVWICGAVTESKSVKHKRTNEIETMK